jgi:hypothetical protein
VLVTDTCPTATAQGRSRLRAGNHKTRQATNTDVLLSRQGRRWLADHGHEVIRLRSLSTRFPGRVAGVGNAVQLVVGPQNTENLGSERAVGIRAKRRRDPGRRDDCYALEAAACLAVTRLLRLVRLGRLGCLQESDRFATKGGCGEWCAGSSGRRVIETLPRMETH